MLYSQGRERTLDELAKLLHDARWKVTQVTRAGTSALAQIVCVPIPASRTQEVRPEPDMEE